MAATRAAPRHCGAAPRASLRASCRQACRRRKWKGSSLTGRYVESSRHRMRNTFKEKSSKAADSSVVLSRLFGRLRRQGQREDALLNGNQNVASSALVECPCLYSRRPGSIRLLLPRGTTAGAITSPACSCSRVSVPSQSLMESNKTGMTKPTDPIEGVIFRDPDVPIWKSDAIAGSWYWQSLRLRLGNKRRGFLPRRMRAPGSSMWFRRSARRHCTSCPIARRSGRRSSNPHPGNVRFDSR